jgi:hypothetical protein
VQVGEGQHGGAQGGGEDDERKDQHLGDEPHECTGSHTSARVHGVRSCKVTWGATASSLDSWHTEPHGFVRFANV